MRELRNFVESLVVLDYDGVLGPDDAQDSPVLGNGAIHSAPVEAMSSNLIGRSLAEVERYYIEEALKLTKNNREEASKILGIGERTLYRKIQDWKQQDRLRGALNDHAGDVGAAAVALEMDETELVKELKKAGLAE